MNNDDGKDVFTRHDEVIHMHHHEEMEHIQRDIKDIKDTVHWLVQHKQDKIRPAIYIPLIGYMLTQALAAVWWGASITASIDSLVEKVEVATASSFNEKDGAALVKYVDLTAANIRLEDAHNKRILDDLIDRQNELEKRVGNLEKTK